MSSESKVVGLSIGALEEMFGGDVGKLFVKMRDRRPSNSAVYGTCVDGKCFFDMIAHTRQFIARPHTITMAGGALVLDPYFEYPWRLWRRYGFPSARVPRRLFLAQIRHGFEHMGVNELFLKIHFPCGVANALGWTPRECLGSLLRARAYVMQQVPAVEITACIHLSLGPDYHQTWGLNVPVWERRHPELLRAPRVYRSNVTPRTMPKYLVTALFGSLNELAKRCGGRPHKIARSQWRARVEPSGEMNSDEEFARHFFLCLDIG